ncbi:LSU ribosomal protein L28p, zinc-independent [[Mycoplasma] cavipharyngis]|uniref:50S ribosomal protein L28 n=1 Tax=[Mycoplasma] cavipharyngis TaxID=92757 RepID=UPI00370426CA
MARRDQLTNRGPLSGNNRSKALNITKRKWNLNLQNVTIVDSNGKTLKLRISTKTLRTLKKNSQLN